MELPAQALACELYLEGGIRGVEIGTLMFGKKDTPSNMELLRLAIPRRVYTQAHIDYVVEALGFLNKRKDKIRGLKIIEEPPYLRHFSAKLAPI